MEQQHLFWHLNPLPRANERTMKRAASSVASVDHGAHPRFKQNHDSEDDEDDAPRAVRSNGTTTAAGGIVYGGSNSSTGTQMCSFTSNRSSTTAKWADEDKTNAMIVKELNEMTLQDRERLFEDIHGVADTFQETDEILEAKLENMEKALRWIKHRDSYNLAHFLSPSYVQDRALRLAILRASEYDPADASKRLVNFFELKHRLFGVDKLVKHITKDDLTPGMRRDMERGYAQIMPHSDRSGRTIVFLAFSMLEFQDWNSHYGMLFFIYQNAVQSEDAQKKGLVFILWMIGGGDTQRNYYAILQKAENFEHSVPGKAAVLHFCYNNPIIRKALSFLNLVMRRNHRLRMRSHFGSHMECIYKLMSYGITIEMLPPVGGSGDINFEYGARRFKEKSELKIAEEAAKPTETIPSSRDVVVGKGYPFQNFIGNIFLSELVERNRERYAALPKKEKTRLAVGVMHYIMEVRGGQFLKRDDTSMKWIVADEKEVREKISFAFRGPKRRGVEYSHESVEYSLEDGYSLFVPPPIRLEEWEKSMYL